MSLTYRIQNISVLLIFQDEIENNHDLIATYRHHITTTMNQENVTQFFRSYNSRNALEVERPVPGGTITVRTLKLVQPLTFREGIAAGTSKMNSLMFFSHIIMSLFMVRSRKHLTKSQSSSRYCFCLSHLPVCFFYRCSSLLIVGDSSPYVEAVVDCNSKLNPVKTTLLKVTERLTDTKMKQTTKSFFF